MKPKDGGAARKPVTHKRSAFSSNWAICSHKTKGRYTDNWKRVTCPRCKRFQSLEESKNA